MRRRGTLTQEFDDRWRNVNDKSEPVRYRLRPIERVDHSREQSSGRSASSVTDADIHRCGRLSDHKNHRRHFRNTSRRKAIVCQHCNAGLKWLEHRDCSRRLRSLKVKDWTILDESCRAYLHHQTANKQLVQPQRTELEPKVQEPEWIDNRCVMQPEMKSISK